ncbi:MAG: hypothetical protein Q8R55_03700 [Candidatus Taylorbacteria bacterium]|nr:hypothetical protein [Candidatus Taylorbacteria bacterium]
MLLFLLCYLLLVKFPEYIASYYYLPGSFEYYDNVPAIALVNVGFWMIIPIGLVLLFQTFKDVLPSSLKNPLYLIGKILFLYPLEILVIYPLQATAYLFEVKNSWLRIIAWPTAIVMAIIFMPIGAGKN